MTAQIGDLLTWEGERDALAGTISLIDHPRIVARPAGDPRAGAYRHTACWRGYVATWRLEAGDLWLDDIDGIWMVVGGPLRADWVNEHVRVRGGACVEYVHMGFSSFYDEVDELDLRAGRLHRHRRFKVPASEWSAP